MKTRSRTLPLLALLSSAAVASPLHAQTPASSPPPAGYPAPVATAEAKPRIDAPQLSGFSGLATLNWNGFGVGARYMIPLGIPSLLSRTRLRDSWALEPGLDYFRVNNNYGGYGDYHYDEILPSVGMMWIVWLREDFAVYPKVEGGYAIPFNNSCTYCSYSHVYVEGAAGLLYSLGGGVTLRAEVGSYGIKGGVAWLF